MPEAHSSFPLFEPWFIHSVTASGEAMCSNAADDSLQSSQPSSEDVGNHIYVIFCTLFRPEYSCRTHQISQISQKILPSTLWAGKMLLLDSFIVVFLTQGYLQYDFERWKMSPVSFDRVTYTLNYILHEMITSTAYGWKSHFNFSIHASPDSKPENLEGKLSYIINLRSVILYGSHESV